MTAASFEEQLTTLETDVEHLCSAYSTEDAQALKSASETQANAAASLLRLARDELSRAKVLTQAGWLELLRAALAFDLGLLDEADAARRRALAIGEDLPDTSIHGWAHETEVWFELTRDRLVEAVSKAEIGLAVVGRMESTGVGIQLALQQAEAAARLGDVDQMHRSLAIARTLLSTHEPPSNPMNHFRFDHSKFDVRQMRILLIVGADDEAEPIALRLKNELERTDGSSAHPMRSSEVLAGLALIAARRNDVEQALVYAHESIEIGRRSRLSFRQIIGSVLKELQRHRGDSGVQSFLDQHATLTGPADHTLRP